jgi:hypothetical protein
MEKTTQRERGLAQAVNRLFNTLATKADLPPNVMANSDFREAADLVQDIVREVESAIRYENVNTVPMGSNDEAETHRHETACAQDKPRDLTQREYLAEIERLQEKQMAAQRATILESMELLNSKAWPATPKRPPRPPIGTAVVYKPGDGTGPYAAIVTGYSEGSGRVCITSVDRAGHGISGWDWIGSE